MELVACEVSSGLRDSEATVAINGYNGDQQFLRVERDFLIHDIASGRHFLTVGLLQKDHTGKFALIELPMEADSGTSRVWVSMSELKSSLPREFVA